MSWLRYILLVVTVGVVLEAEQVQAFAHADSSGEVSGNVTATKVDHIIDISSQRKVLKGDSRSSLESQNGFDVGGRKADHALSEPAHSRDLHLVNKPAPVLVGPIKTILPGLPSPLVAVVDPAEATAWTAKLSEKDKKAQTSVLEPVTAGPRPILSLDTGVDENGPVSVVASTSPAANTNSTGLLIPFGQNVGAAAFRRANLLMVVFDSNKPVDLASIAGDPVFGTASYSLLALGAVMTLPLSKDVQVEVLRKPEGWLVEVGKPGREMKAIQPKKGLENMTLPVLDPGHIVIVNDPVRKTDLLVGTVRQDRQNMPLLRHEPDFNLTETLLGLVVERLADRLDMRATAGSFIIEQTVREGLVRTGNPDLEITIPFSRSLDLPPVDDAELEKRYKTALATTAAAAVADRRLTRLTAAEAALALGEAREAGELAALADQDAPAGPQPGRARFLRAVAAVLDREPEATKLLEDPRIINTDEVNLWRAIDLARRQPENPDAARIISRFLPIIESYPRHLRDQLRGTAAISLVLAGGPSAMGQVQSLSGGGSVKLAQALVLKNSAENDKALAALDSLASDIDPAVVFVASETAIAIRLKLGQIKPKQAADRLNAQTLNARMADKELALKLQVASLYQQDADWPAALGTLHDISISFPGASDQVAHESAEILKQMMSSNPPPNIAELSMVESNLDLLQAGRERTRVSIELARHFAGLELPDHAASLIEDAVVHTSPGAERASLGVELAQLRLDQADVAGAVAALDATATADLPAELSDARAFMQARAKTAVGQTDAALAALGPLHGPEVDDLRASELALKHDWQGEAAALASLAAQRIPATGPLSGSMEDLALRLVAATARSGDQSALRQIEVSLGTRFKTQSKLDMLRLLTSDSVKTEGDLARSARELSASQSALSALATAPDKNGS